MSFVIIIMALKNCVNTIVMLVTKDLLLVVKKVNIGIMQL
jgi:hypothetical protein